MKKILGLDLGVGSIGWALISENDNEKKIMGMGCRVIPLTTDDKDEFASGRTITKNQKRTQSRTQRRGYFRYKLRRKYLTEELLKNKMFDEKLFKLKPIELWGLRAKAAEERVSLTELGRILYHLNQKRGYKSSRSEENKDKKDTEYVAEVKNRYQQLKEAGITIGRKFFEELKKNEHYKIKQQVFPREAYIEEFETICNQQKKYYPEVLTDDFILRLRDEIIYFQRRLKSQKGLVSVCDFEGFLTKTKEGKEIFVGPKVSPKSSPLFQVCKIWEIINNISIKNKKGEEYNITHDKKLEIFEYLDNNEKLTQAELFKILELSKEDGWYANKQIAKGLQGNIPKSQIMKFIDKDSPLLEFELLVKEIDEETFLIDRKTGEVLNSTKKKIVEPDLENQPLYKLWHTIYSISEKEECTNALRRNFSIPDDIAEKLASIDFVKISFGNKSVKAMRKILPYLMDGYKYSDACSLAGYNHSDSLTKEEAQKRITIDFIPLLPKNSLRQPVVEKILNQLINIVNAIIQKYGKPDEIRIELARELKQSKEERNETFKNITKIERENEAISKRLEQEYNLRATRNNIIKWRLFHEMNDEESIINATCIYCGKQFGITDALTGNNVDIEHIIPKSLLFDDSQSNKTLSHRSCNEAKGNNTAYDFMQQKGETQLQEYINRINDLYKRKIIGKAKRDKLLMPQNKIPRDFIDRQLRETQYIAKKAKQILEQVCTNVWSTSGGVTAYLRRIWGWEDILMDLQIPKYREFGLTEFVEWETEDRQKHKKEVIKDWSKRDDQRHHAIDALIIACTKQGFIQRINNLSSQHTRDEIYAEIENQNTQFKEKLNLLDKYLLLNRPFSTAAVAEKAAEILVSYKAGKKVATKGKRKIKKGGKKIVVQEGIIVPRGALSEESVYGKITTLDRNKPVKYLFNNPHLIFKQYIKELVEERLKRYNNDITKALASLKKEPIYLDPDKKIELKYASCLKEEYVIKYPLESIKEKDADFIIDDRIRELVKSRLEMFKGKEKEAFKEPLYFNEEKKIPIKTVRMFTGLTKVEPLRKDETGRDISFVKPGNNHHIAFYIDENGEKKEHVCTFWHAVERVKYGIPVIITRPKEVWDKIIEEEYDYPESLLEKLPADKWVMDISLQQNEMFVLGMEQELFDEAMKKNDKVIISDYLYRVQKLSYIANKQINIWFRKHIETQIIDSQPARDSKRYYNLQSIDAFYKLNPKKIYINNLGDIIK